MVKKSIFERRPDLSVYLEEQRRRSSDLRHVANDEAALVYAMIRGMGLSKKPGSKELAKELGLEYGQLSRLYYKAYREIDRIEWVVPAPEIFDKRRYDDRKDHEKVHLESRVLEKLF